MQEQPKTTVTQSEKYETYEVTAYTLHPSETGGKQPGDKGYGITASGKRVERGDCACPSYLPFGTKIYIPEMDRTFTCVDRGASIKGRRLDIFMYSRSNAINFGRKTMQIKIINKGANY